ncbi:Arc family DNA-binding protein [Pseudomonas aeruginosa]|nr:Arc family DNA-binding protein [Pseudomonas aeruginosa]
MRDQLKQKAADNHRSANSEIVYRLERSNALEEELARANRMVDETLRQEPAPAGWAGGGELRLQVAEA